jgi:hypothetical protein
MNVRSADADAPDAEQDLSPACLGHGHLAQLDGAWFERILHDGRHGSRHDARSVS